MASTRAAFYSTLLRRLWKFLAAYVALLLGASAGFYMLESGRDDLGTSFYWAVVTIATIGYGDVVPTNANARWFTIGVILVAVFLTAYLISIIISVVNDESHKRNLGMLGTDFTGHVVVIGYAGVGRAAVRELLAVGERVAVATADVNELPNIRALAPEHRIFATFYATGDAEILSRLNAAAAKSVVICTPDDTTNLIIALAVRQNAPSVRIVVSVTRAELRPTLRSAGVTYVASPNDMGGRLVANASFRPEVVNVFEDLTSAAYGTDIGEYVLTEKTPISRQALSEAETMVRASSGCIVIGYARPRGPGEYVTVLNPPPSFHFQPGDALLVIASLENLKKLEAWLGVPQGR
ncbi:MAG: NAD-binding protein [Thermoplasmata archaeon]